MSLEAIMTNLTRIYHPYWDWEEVDHNMWGSVKNRKHFLKLAIYFTGDHIKYGRFMIKVVNKWKFSCEHNLTDLSQNRKAWIGHAACALALGCPEDITRQAWGHLSDLQQAQANKKAATAIAEWEQRHLEDLCQSAE
jgi:hypothetical protein